MTTSNRMPEGYSILVKSRLSNDRNVSFGKIGACTGAAVLLPRVPRLFFFPFPLGFVFGAFGVVRARTRSLVPGPMACIVLTSIQCLKTSTQLTESCVSKVEIERKSRFKIGSILHTPSKRSVQLPRLDSPPKDRTNSSLPSMSYSKSLDWRDLCERGAVDAATRNKRLLWLMVTPRLLNSIGEGPRKCAATTGGEGRSLSVKKL